jgi:plasmid maintenance system killer protein
MIKTFRDKDTESIFARRFSKKFPTDLHKTAWRKLAVLDAVERLDDLHVPPGNWLRNSLATAPGSTVSVSTINGVSVFNGVKAMPMRSKSRIIIRRQP